MKMHIGSCCGNSFLIMDCRHRRLGREGKIDIATKELSKYGVDSLLILEGSGTDSLFVEIFERDGSESESCGNGAHAISNLLGLNDCTIGMKGGKVHAVSNGKRQSIRINISASEIREVNDTGDCLFVKVGEPHLIYFVDNVFDWNLFEIGSRLQSVYPEGINVNAIEKIKDFCYAIRTFERGVLSETKSCGTGSLSAYRAIAHVDNSLNGESIELRSAGGTHWVSRHGDVLQLEVLKEHCEIRCL
ncbi:MAG: hypothetical protein HZA15_02600 [Nitrospirae bacterium]|nr:hypothetical protein [Nitrospirota bacterium]